MSCTPGKPCSCKSNTPALQPQEDQRPTAEDGHRALQDHVLERARIARARYGPVIDYDAMMKILDDRALVRFPVGLRFDSGGLVPGEFAHAEPLDEHASTGFCMFIHPDLQARRDLLPYVIAYQLPAVNYGDIIECEDCEVFGAALLGMEVDAYYQKLCEIADGLPAQG